MTAPAAAAPPAPATSIAQEQADVITGAGAVSALVFTRNGDDVTAAASGVRAQGAPVAARANDRFRAGSITKSLLATVVLQLADEGSVDLDAPLARHLPGVLPYAHDVTVRQLLQHTGGVPDFVDDELLLSLLEQPDLQWSPQQLASDVAQLPRLQEQVGRFSYSNSNYLLLGLLVEHLTGDALDRVMSDRILRPAGMHHTSFPDDRRIRGSHLHGYVPVGPDTQLDVTSTDPSWAWASGDIITTTADLARFYAKLLSGALLSPSRWPRCSRRSRRRPTPLSTTDWGSRSGTARAATRGDTPVRSSDTPLSSPATPAAASRWSSPFRSRWRSPRSTPSPPRSSRPLSPHSARHELPWRRARTLSGARE
jgi:D-alanyl-D-alanine carboxypeptidase